MRAALTSYALVEIEAVPIDVVVYGDQVRVAEPGRDLTHSPPGQAGIDRVSIVSIRARSERSHLSVLQPHSREIASGKVSPLFPSQLQLTDHYTNIKLYKHISYIDVNL
jgi:hypothetical protein